MIPQGSRLLPAVATLLLLGLGSGSAAVRAAEPEAPETESAEAEAGTAEAGAAAPRTSPAADAVGALRTGNRLFRGGRLEEAAAAYLRGWDPQRPHPLLAYNLGSTLHHLDRLPEAILWYRRAADSSDPWLDENLSLARRTLGAPRAPDPGLAARLASHSFGLGVGAIVLAWLVPVLLLLPGPSRTWGAGLVAAAALALGGTALAVERWAPREIVLLEDCGGARGELPAGTEAWGEPTDDGWRIAGLPLVCEAGAVGEIDPRI